MQFYLQWYTFLDVTFSTKPLIQICRSSTNFAQNNFVSVYFLGFPPKPRCKYFSIFGVTSVRCEVLVLSMMQFLEFLRVYFWHTVWHYRPLFTKLASYIRDSLRFKTHTHTHAHTHAHTSICSHLKISSRLSLSASIVRHLKTLFQLLNGEYRCLTLCSLANVVLYITYLPLHPFPP